MKKWWVVFFATTALTLVSVFFIDQPLTQWLKANGVGNYYRLFRTATDLAESDLYFILAVILILWALSGRFLKSKKVTFGLYHGWILQQALFLLYSLIGAGMVLHFMKFVFGRQRPHMTDDFQAHIFEPLNTHWHFHSFPSGHSQTIFTVATVLGLLVPRARGFAYLVASFVASTRVFLQAHFMSDVIFGAFIGIYVPTLIWRQWMKEKVKSAQTI